MSWESKIEEMADRQARAAELGGPERVERQRRAGKLTVRERIDAILDGGSFQEIGALTGKVTYDDRGNMVEYQPTNFVAGRGRIDARQVLVGGDDFTVRGGHADGSIWEKQAYLERLAVELQVPMVRLLDGSSGGGSVVTYLEEQKTYVPPLPGFAAQVELLGVAPVVAAALGPVVGLGAARAVMSHFSVMVGEISQVFVAGPPLVAYASHEELTKEELGGVAVHGANGVVDNVADSEADAFDQVRRFLSYLPQNVFELAPVVESPDPADRREESLVDVIPLNRRRVYDVAAVISAVFDQATFFEIGGLWGRSMVTGLARIGGRPVGVIANNPKQWGGAVTADGAQKVIRLVDLCETFHLPIVSLVDNPGFAIGSAAEQAATIRHGGRMIAALYQASVPYFSVILRRTFGVAGAAFVDCTNPRLRMAWPSGDWGSLPLEGGIEAAYRRALQQADDPVAMREELLEQFEAVRSPLRTAEAFGIEEIIDPRDTRPRLVEAVELAYRRLPRLLGRAGRYRP
jgi:acetyl-CoA carboxylase carboxyltransferase component